MLRFKDGELIDIVSETASSELPDSKRACESLKFVSSRYDASLFFSGESQLVIFRHMGRSYGIHVIIIKIIVMGIYNVFEFMPTSHIRTLSEAN